MLLENNYTYRDIVISKSEKILTIENASFKRVLDLSRAIPRTISLLDKSNGKERASKDKQDVDFCFAGYNPPNGDRTVDYQLESIEVFQKDTTIFDSESVEIKLLIIEKVQCLTYQRSYFVYPELAVISSRTAIKSLTTPNIYWNRRQDFNNLQVMGIIESAADSLRLADEINPSKVVEFVGRTDYTDEQVIEKKIDAERLNGNLLFCADADGDGFYVLQEAPPSQERRDFENYDFRFVDRELYSCGWGIEAHEAAPDELISYRHTIGLFSKDGTDGTADLKRYLKSRFPVDIEKHCSVMVNPWGCGQFPKLVNEKFLLDELEAAAELNATHYQIDDGWQKGRALAELSLNNRVGDSEFWSINKDLLPNGFGPLLECAGKVGIEAELWVAPSSNQHYHDWQEFADILLDFHEQYGFNIFKIDFIKTRTKAAEDNLEKMLRYLREKTGGEIYFNLDTTNGQRPGYFMFLEYGNVFLENRYACNEWGMGYHPEKTLNNLWNLSKYMRSQSLQIEFTDPGIINYEFYKNKGMTPPDVYDPEYWAGVAMFANPLVWLAPSLLDKKYADIYKKVIALHRKYADEIFSGEIHPIGQQPNGSSITGFQSHNDQTGEGLFIVYREIEAPESTELELILLDPKQEYELFELSLEKECKESEFLGNKLRITLPHPGTWRLFRYKKITS